MTCTHDFCCFDQQRVSNGARHAWVLLSVLTNGVKERDGHHVDKFFSNLEDEVSVFIWHWERPTDFALLETCRLLCTSGAEVPR